MKKKPVAQPGTAELLRNPQRILRVALIVAVYLFTFIIFDFITKQFEELPGIVAWYPPAGLTYTLLLVFGLRFAPAVTIALLISSILIYRMPQPTYLLFLWAFIISLIYSVAAAFLRKRIHFDWRLQKLRDVTWFVFTTVLVSALLAVLSVSSSSMSSDMPRSEVLRAIFLWWIGETVGVLTVTPFLLIYVMPGLKRFMEGQQVKLPARWSFPRPTLSAIGQAFSLAFTLYWVFGAPVPNEYQPLYFITLPLIWIALQRGIKGVAVAILALNSGVVLALWFFRFDLSRLGELQLLMILNCFVGLLMGAVVTERKQVETALRENERELKNAQSLGRLGNWSFDCESQVITWSEQVYQLYERSPVLGPPTPEEETAYYSPEQSQILRNYRTRTIKEGKSFDYDLEVNLPSGKHLSFSAKMQPVKDATGRVVRLFGTVQDVTELKRTAAERQALLEIMQGMSSTESLTDLLELIRQSLAKVIYAENFFVVFRNKSTDLFEEVFAVDKYDPAMPPSKLERSITSYVFRTGEPLLLTQAKFEELVARGEVELVGTNPAIWLGAPLKTPNETIGVIAVQNYEDPDCYSERDKDFLAYVGVQVSLAIVRKQAEQEIVSLAKFPSENPNPILRLSQDGIVMYANAASGALLNMWGCRVDGSAPQFWRDLVTQVLASKENKIIDIECDGKVYSMFATPVAEMGYTDLYGRDITERKQAEKDLKIYSERLEEMVEERTRELRLAQEQLVRQERLAVLGQLAGSVSHELRNPLGVISNAAYLLRLVQPDANERVKEYLNIIEAETQNGEKIITDLWDFTRNHIVNREPAAVSDLFHQTLERFPVLPPVKVVTKIAKNLPLIYADPHHVVHMLGNLTVNACQAMPKGGKLTLFASEEGAMIVIAVRDTGEGISPENMGRLFEPLFSTKINGIGLGLAVCKKLAEANDGRIEVESEPDKGSTFTLFLPVAR